MDKFLSLIKKFRYKTLYSRILTTTINHVDFGCKEEKETMLSAQVNGFGWRRVKITGYRDVKDSAMYLKFLQWKERDL